MEPPLITKCPVCKKPSDFKYRPFCSKRCAEIDLAHWLRGDYKIADDTEEGTAGQKDEGEDEEG
jgi:hypothetical protein